MEGDSCAICGGDGRIDNGFGRTTTCPACHGSGRRADTSGGIRDVTKTKASHYQPTNKAAIAEKAKWPSTHDGGVLATEVRDCALLSASTKARLITEIMDYESSHGSCTQTFIKKIRKQTRPSTPSAR